MCKCVFRGGIIIELNISANNDGKPLLMIVLLCWIYERSAVLNPCEFGLKAESNELKTGFNGNY